MEFKLTNEPVMGKPVIRGAITQVVGLSIKYPQVLSDRGFTNRDLVAFAILRAIDEGVRANRHKPLLEITNPCGESVAYENLNDIPTVSTPCPCGDPRHWLIKYEVTD